MAQERNESAAENGGTPDGSSSSHDPDQTRKIGCIPAMLFGIWAIFALVGAWITVDWKSKYQVNVSSGLPTDGGRPLNLLLVIGVPCLVATVVAVRMNRAGHRSRLAVGWSYVFAACATVSGAILLAVPAHISCREVIGVTDLFSDYGPTTCPSDYLNAANDAVLAINVASAGLLFIGLVAAIVTAWADRTARRQTRSEDG